MDAQAVERYGSHAQEGPGPAAEPYRPNASFQRALAAKRDIESKLWPGRGVG